MGRQIGRRTAIARERSATFKRFLQSYSPSQPRFDGFLDTSAQCNLEVDLFFENGPDARGDELCGEYEYER